MLADGPLRRILYPLNLSLIQPDIEAYLVGGENFGLPRNNLLKLFDSQKPPNEIARTITRFLRDSLKRLKTGGCPGRDVIIYYLGHGGFIGPNRDYFLAIHSTIQNQEGISSIRMADLARVLVEEATHLRRYLILDCCFAASAYREFQSAPLQVAREKTLDSFPNIGTALLCSSGPRDPSIAPEGEAYTMFSGALLDVLHRGYPNFKVPLSLEELGRDTWARIREKYPLEGVRPSVLSPDQREGDIAGIPLFPNAAPRASGTAHRPERAQSDIKPDVRRMQWPFVRKKTAPVTEKKSDPIVPRKTDNLTVNDIINVVRECGGQIIEIKKERDVWSLKIKQKEMTRVQKRNVETLARNEELADRPMIKLYWQ